MVKHRAEGGYHLQRIRCVTGLQREEDFLDIAQVERIAWFLASIVGRVIDLTGCLLLRVSGYHLFLQLLFPVFGGVGNAQRVERAVVNQVTFLNNMKTATTEGLTLKRFTLS
jgi:hypothetical protein